MDVKEGIASIALLPSGSLSGHFIHLPSSVCYGLHGTELSCERECSRGEDYRLIKLTITDFKSKEDRVVVVECRGQDATRFENIDHVHGWGEDVIHLVEKEQQHGKSKISITFVCDTMKAEEAAEDHIRKFMPKLSGLDAVVNIGPMTIKGLDFTSTEYHPFLSLRSSEGLQSQAMDNGKPAKTTIERLHFSEEE